AVPEAWRRWRRVARSGGVEASWYPSVCPAAILIADVDTVARRTEVNHGQSYFQTLLFVTMDTDFIETFIAVAEHGSIAEAARRLNLTSAAVTQRVRVLEDDIGARLLVRAGRTVRPTDSGIAILERARNFLKDARDLRSIAATGKPAGQLRLGAVQTVLTGLFPGILKRMGEKYPQIEIVIMRAGSADLYGKVLAGELDLALIAHPPFAVPKVCDWRVLRNEPLIMLPPPSVKSRDPRVVLASEPFIRQDRKSWAGRIIDVYLRKTGIQPKEHFELDGYESIVVMVGQGLG